MGDQQREMFAIFDSLGRQCGGEEMRQDHLFGSLKALQDEAEEDGDGLTYAIAKRPVGQPDNWTFEV